MTQQTTFFSSLLQPPLQHRLPSFHDSFSRGINMPAFIMPLSSIDEVRTFNSLDEFTRGYIEAMFWTECNSDSEPELEDATFDDLAPETLTHIIADCASFQNMPDSPDNDSDLEAYAYDYSLAYAGHDFWLTR